MSYYASLVSNKFKNWVEVFLTRTNNIQRVQAGLADDSVQMSIHHHKTRTRSPVTKKTRLDILVCESLLAENIVLQEDHCCE